MLKWIKFSLILFLIPGFPLFQCDQLIDIGWVVSENSAVVKSDDSGLSSEKCLCFDSKPILPSLNRISFILKLKNPFSVLYSSFQGVSPFWRPPPD